MTENKRLIQGSYGVQRYLHSDEVFCKERNWNINLPSEREFKDGYCIITDKDNTAYSTDELVELLNEFQNENEQLKSDLKECRKLKTKRLNKIRNHRAVIEDLGGSIRAYKGKIEQTNEKIDKIKEAMEDTGALTKRQLEEILND